MSALEFTFRGDGTFTSTARIRRESGTVVDTKSGRFRTLDEVIELEVEGEPLLKGTFTFRNGMLLLREDGDERTLRFRRPIRKL